jgi:hypothetical protein
MQYMMQPQFNLKKLKLAVIATLGAFAISLPSQVLALGLGDIDVRSHLGQPLRAKIRVLGASSISDPNCFKLGSDSGNPNQLTNARLKLGNVTNDSAVLSISTGEVISEPIVNLSVVAECGTSIRRDYVLLMDPPFAEAERESNNASTNNSRRQSNEDTFDNADSSNATAANISEQEARPQPQTRSRPAKKASTKKQRTRKKSRPSVNLNTVNDANFGAVSGADTEARPRTSANVTPEIKLEATPKELKEPKEVVPIVTMPRLTVSNGASSNAANMIGLRLDNQLRFDPAAPPIEQAAEIAVQDEVTVMNNRMAHLEEQINKLKLRNDTLENENKIKDLRIAQDQEKLPSNMSQWLTYLTYGVLLIGGYFAFDWWRRRRQNLQSDNSESLWENLHQKDADAIKTDELDTSEEFFGGKTVQLANTSDENLTAEPEYAGGFMPTQAMEAPFYMEEDSSESNILDHADVFLSHGRTSLAIQLLQNHLLDFPKQSVTIWLFLLDLLAKVNLQAVYEQTAMECREHFNVKIPEFGASPDAAYRETSANQSLESYPRLTTGLQQAWGTPAAITFIDDLIYNSRLEPRVGFDKNLIEELVLLKGIAMEELKSGIEAQSGDKIPTISAIKEAQIATKKAEKLLAMDDIPDEQAAPHLHDEQPAPHLADEPAAAAKPAKSAKREELPPLEFISDEPAVKAPAAETLADVKPGKTSKKAAETFEFNLVDFNQKH